MQKVTYVHIYGLNYLLAAALGGTLWRWFGTMSRSGSRAKRHTGAHARVHEIDLG